MDILNRLHIEQLWQDSDGLGSFATGLLRDYPHHQWSSRRAGDGLLLATQRSSTGTDALYIHATDSHCRACFVHDVERDLRRWQEEQQQAEASTSAEVGELAAQIRRKRRDDHQPPLLRWLGEWRAIAPEKRGMTPHWWLLLEPRESGPPWACQVMCSGGVGMPLASLNLEALGPYLRKLDLRLGFPGAWLLTLPLGEVPESAASKILQAIVLPGWRRFLPPGGPEVLRGWLERPYRLSV